MYKKLLTLVSLIVLLFAVSCGGGSAALPDPGQQGGGGNGGGGGNAPAATIDDVAPEIAISGITADESYGLLEAGANTLTVKGVAADPSGVSNMAIRINDVLLASSNDSQVEFDWDVTGFSDGSYDVEIQAADGEGNVGEAHMTVYVNNVIWVPPFDLFPDLPLEVVDPGIIDPFPDPPFEIPDFPLFPGI